MKLFYLNYELWFSWKLFHVAPNGLEAATIINFFENFS